MHACIHIYTHVFICAHACVKHICVFVCVCVCLCFVRLCAGCVACDAASLKGLSMGPINRPLFCFLLGSDLWAPCVYWDEDSGSQGPMAQIADLPWSQGRVPPWYISRLAIEESSATWGGVGLVGPGVNIKS